MNYCPPTSAKEIEKRIKRGNRDFAISGAIHVVLLLLLIFGARAWAHDDGQWGNADPSVREWYQSLMRPDAPTSSCCGEADAYWADEVHVRGGKTYATITDDRDDAILHRPHIAMGTEVEVPSEKLKWNRGNPTGHNIIFLSSGTSFHYVWCFVQGAGG